MRKAKQVEPEEREAEIALAVEARPKLRIVKEYGVYKVGDVVSLTKGRRDFLIAGGFAKAEK
jgi:hypothetical protein